MIEIVCRQNAIEATDGKNVLGLIIFGPEDGAIYVRHLSILHDDPKLLARMMIAMRKQVAPALVRYHMSPDNERMARLGKMLGAKPVSVVYEFSMLKENSYEHE